MIKIVKENWDPDSRYYVCAYYGLDFRGLENELNTDDWSEVEEFAHEELMNGNQIEIEDNETGKSVRINSDDYVDNFEEMNGEFPYDANLKSWYPEVFEGYGRKWKPSKTARREFAQTMNDIDKFCDENGISCSASKDSYYFTINGQKYRVSNHSVETSNAGAYDSLGNQVRSKYHPDGREDDTIYIHAGKTRIRDIYNDLKAGYELDGRGNRKR